jgi:hypothetical protein
MSSVLLSAPALRSRATRRALAAYAGRAIAWIMAARAAIAVARWVEDPPAGRDPKGWLAGMGLFALCFGVLWLLNAARLWWWLRRHPWVEWRCTARVVPRSELSTRGTPRLLLRRDGDDGHVVSPICTRWRWPALRECDDGVVWMAGDPERGGVVAPPGGRHLVWVRRTTPAKLRARLHEALAAPQPPRRSSPSLRQ